MEETRIRAFSPPMTMPGVVALYVVKRDLIEKTTTVGTKVVMEERADGMFPAEPTVLLESTAAQELMDQLWSCGVRPAEGAGSAGAMAAVQEHLKDLRAVSERLMVKLMSTSEPTNV